MTQIFESGKEYWEIARRYHANRDKTNLIKPTAVRDMQRLLQRCRVSAVQRRINLFIATHTKKSPNGVA